MTLTLQQQRLIETAANGVPPASREAFQKFIANVLRGKLGRPSDTDVWGAAHEAMRKYADQPTQH
jgi:hypothetical protein